MKYLPFEDFEIDTELTSDEVFYRLRAAVETKETWQILIHKIYLGKVFRKNFRISKVTKWWEREVPAIVSGEIQSKDFGSYIRVKVRLHWYSVALYSIWLGYFWYLLFSGVTNLMTRKIQTGIWQYVSPVDFLPSIVFFAIGYLFLEISFKSDVKRAKEFLMNLLSAKLGNIKYVDKILGLTESKIMYVLLLANIVGLVLATSINLIR